MKKDKSPVFVDLVAKYSQSHILLNNLKERTKHNYRSYLSSIKKALTALNCINIPVSKVDPNLIEEMRVYLLSNGRAMTNASRTIDLCKATVEWCKMKGLTKENKISNVATKRSPIKDVVHLEAPEQQKWLLAQFEDRTKEVAKDLYLVQCETGMSFGDLWSYQILKDQYGEWIFNKRNKTNREYWVPLSPTAKMIHKKYNGKLPSIKNKHYNAALKEIASDLEINKHLTSHTARKTFATRMYDEGWTIESIADMMGITLFVLTTYYIKKSRRRLEMEVKQRQSA